MITLKKIFKFLFNMKYYLTYWNRFKGLTLEQERYILEKQFKWSMGYNLNLDNPQTFNEKIQWLKLYDRNPLMTIGADKYKVREYVKEKIGEEYLIPLLGVWDSPDEIDFDSLPNQFVLKVNWGSGQNIIVKDKSKLNIEETKEKLRNWLKPINNHYYDFFEWCYKNIEPKIICEKYIEQMDGFLVDYKIHTYSSVPTLAQIIDRWETHKETIYLLKNWEKTELHFTYDLLGKSFEKNETISRIEYLSSILAVSFPYVRVDFYDVNNQIFFGELTFYPGNGNLSMPIEWDYKLGEMIELPINKGENK